jgi:hypothetical protein
MFRRTTFLSGLILSIAAASTVEAQDRPRGGGLQFGGPGGFGGAAFDVRLLATPEVQKELSISDEQKGLIEDMIADVQNQMQQGFRQGGGGGFQNFQNLSDEERRKLQEEGQKRMAEMNKKTEEMMGVVLEPKQSERFGQMRLQRAGVGSFSRADIAEKLALTQEQKDKMRKIQEEAPRPDFRVLFNQDATEEERTAARTKMREQTEKTNTEILNVLTAEQKETWAKMQGKKFEFPPQQFGGFGGRRPGGQ